MNIPSLIGAALLALFASAASANDGTPPTSVEVKGIRDPVLQPYRIMSAGFEAMEKHRALAPHATELKFLLTARKSAAPGAMDGLTLRLDGDNTDQALPLDEEHVFTLPRSDTASADNARLVLNRSQNFVNWMPRIRSPGVPQDHVRLGDARMECQVIVRIVKKMVNFALILAANGIIGSDWCNADKFTIPTLTGKRLLSATLVHGTERIALGLDEGGKAFLAPLKDKRYGNDDLIELRFAAEP